MLGGCIFYKLFIFYKRRRTFYLVSVVASGKKYSIVPVYILKHLHTVTLVQSQTIAIREPRDAGAWHSVMAFRTFGYRRIRFAGSYEYVHEDNVWRVNGRGGSQKTTMIFSKNQHKNARWNSKRSVLKKAVKFRTSSGHKLSFRFF